MAEEKSLLPRGGRTKSCVFLRHRWFGFFVPFAVTLKLQFLRVGVVLLFGATRS